jgi:hypothetical protein
MTSDRDLVSNVSAVRPVNENQTPTAAGTQRNIGRPLPVGGQSVGKPPPISTPTSSPLERPTENNPSLQSQVPFLNKHLNDSGEPNRFRMDPNSGDTSIQEINPATGEVVGEYSVSAFPALAKSLGLMGSLVNSRA